MEGERGESKRMEGAHTETEKREAGGTERQESDIGGRKHEMCGRGKGGEDGASVVVVGTQNEEQRLLCR